ncbi:hypothetical protein Aperf_G00000109056 [Anoplocephala perfoliata]
MSHERVRIKSRKDNSDDEVSEFSLFMVFSLPVIPSIVSLPAPVTYLGGLTASSPTLTCEVWPPTANVSLYLAHPSIASHPGLSLGGSPRSPLGLEPIPTGSSSAPFSISRRLVPGNFTTSSMTTPAVPAFSNAAVSLEVFGGERDGGADVWRRVDSVDVHCRADTEFGAVLSAPFRVVQSRLPEFSNPTGLPQTIVQEFINGNVAFVSCRIPPDSRPLPIVQFFLNGSLIDNNIRKSASTSIVPSFVYHRGPVRAYLDRVMKCEISKSTNKFNEPNEDQVLLLINSFKASDEGDYGCKLTNPVTKATVWSPEITRLQVRAPDKPVPVRILLTLSPQDNSSAAASRQITVREGDNVTLFCIMEGAPPPKVHTHPHNTGNDRYIMDQDFARLRLDKSPNNTRLPNLGLRAEFQCSPSNPSVTPFWLFNGEPFYTISPKLLVIDSVKESDLGLYQCIARTLTPDGRTDEWVSATALLSLDSDKIITKASDLVQFIPNAYRTPSNHPEAITTTKEMTPLAEMALDNFAVYLTWNVSDVTLYSGYHNTMASSASGQPQSFQDQPIAFQIDYASLIREPMLNPALKGLIPPEPALWSKTERLNKMWKKSHGFVIGSPLEPGKTYRFRVRAVSVETGLDVIPPSDWSEPISTHHISNAPPPRITSVQPYHDGRFNVTWEYVGDSNNQSIGDGTTETFRPDFFLILVRPVLRSPPSPSSNGDSVASMGSGGSDVGSRDNDALVHYGRYRATLVNGSDAREAFIFNLNASISYQLVVYGVKYENGARRITRFSEAKYATLPEVPGFGSFSLIRAVTENKPIFIGLGALALVLFLVALVLVIMCIARQRKYRRRRRVKHNGFLTGHTESEKYPSQSQQPLQSQQSAASAADHLRAASPSAVKAAQAQGQAMLMGTLMRQSNFSEPSSHHMGAHAQHQQFQQAQAQQQFAQQQAAYMGSAMHLGGGGSGYYGTHQHPHHQSHHSLLLPTPSGGQMVGSPMFHSGTLPPGMRAGGMRLQSPPPPVAQMGAFGSQQVLNQMEGLDQQQQASLMRDYYHQQQQQQLYQQHLMNQQQQASFVQYATNNPAGYLSPQQQQMIDTLTRHQSQGGYPYGGSIHSGTSLKRDPNGSIHEESTLLARSPMSPHPPPMLGDQIPPPGYFQTPMYGQQHPLMSPPPPPPVQMSGAPYYPGQPQGDPTHLTRMHSMGHHTDGESIYSYFSQQDVCHPQPHALLNPLPEENQMNLGYTESGSQTAGLNGTSGTASPPAGGTVSGHRHHRRRRRKQQQTSQSSTQQFGSGSGEGDGFQFPVHNSEQIAMMTIMDGQGHSGTNGMNGSTPPSAAGLEHPGGGGNEVVNQMENLRSGNQSFDRSMPPYGASSGMGVRSPLPPPSQPPPPPPPAMMMMPMQMGNHTNPGGVVMSNPNSSSLNRRGGGNTGSVLGGAPPRIRDYSEYGIPTSVPNSGSGNVSQPPPGVVAMTAASNNKQLPATPQSGGSGSLRYREGQA